MTTSFLDAMQGILMLEASTMELESQMSMMNH